MSLFFSALGVVLSVHAQTKNQGSFISAADQELSVKNVLVAPFTDNVSGIYAKPLTEELSSLLSKDAQWSLLPFPDSGVKIEGLDSRAADVAAILKKVEAQGLFTARITRGPAGLQMRLSFHVGPSGQALLSEEWASDSRFEINELRTDLQSLFSRLRQKMPYQGILQSRRGQQVTLNLGRKFGLRDGDEVSVIQILKTQRHPKTKLLVGTDKEILGKVKIFKADEELSFGHIVLEKEPNLLASGMKVLPDRFVAYPNPVVSPDGQALENLAQREDRDVIFGKKPIEWLPEHPPQFGKVQVLGGLGQYSQTVKMQTSGSIDGSQSLSPSLALSGEGWITKDWFLEFDLRQSVFSVNNALPGSNPGKLDFSLSRYRLAVGRNLLLSDDILGPKIQLSLGFGRLAARVTESTPVLFSNMEYGGMLFGFRFSTPISEDNLWDLGAGLRYYWSPGVTESVSSGSAGSVSVTDFGFQVGYRLSSNFRYVGEFDLEHLSSDFSGGGSRPDPASNITHKMNTIFFGIEYLF